MTVSTTPLPKSLEQSTFASFLGSRPKIIVHLGTSSRPATFLSGVIKHFSGDLGNDVAFGCLDTSKLVYTPWPLKFVRDIFNEALTTAPSGYYLFEHGQVRAFHPGSVPQSNAELKADLITYGVGGVLSALFESPRLFDGVTDAVNAKYARAVIAHFEEALAPPTKKKDTTDWTNVLENQEIETQDPYTLLQIQPTATDEEIRDAFRRQTALNHPDKVAHLAPAIQKFASDQFKAMKAAYDQIVADRKKTGR